MKLRDWVVPDELQSAAQAGVKLFSAAAQTSHFWIKHAIASAIPFLVGAALAYGFVRLGVRPGSEGAVKDVLTAVLTFSAVLSGFVVTLMLFTGRTDGAGALSIDAAQTYVAKVTYLLFSQAITLIVSLVCGLCCVGWLLINASLAPDAVAKVLFIAVFGFLALSTLRTLVLPFQIYELHNYALENLVAEKHAAFEQELAEQRESLKAQQVARVEE